MLLHVMGENQGFQLSGDSGRLLKSPNIRCFSLTCQSTVRVGEFALDYFASLGLIVPIVWCSTAIR